MVTGNFAILFKRKKGPNPYTVQVLNGGVGSSAGRTPGQEELRPSGR